MWTTELMPRHGHVLLVIYRNGETMGSIQFLEGDEDIPKWTKLVETLNELSPST